jgi:hypothetical protein
MQEHFVISANLLTALIYVAAYWSLGWGVRVVLRSAQIPRWTIIVVVVSVSHLATPFIRESLSRMFGPHFHSNGDYTPWNTVWSFAGDAAYLLALLAGNHIPKVFLPIGTRAALVSDERRQGDEPANAPMGREPSAHEVPWKFE